MKISNILFIGFFSLLTLISLAFLIPVDEEYLKSKRHRTEYAGHNFEVPHFKFLKVHKNCELHIYSAKSDTFHLRINQPIDSAIIAPEFYMSGDTLIVTSTRAYRNNEAYLYCGDIEGVEVLGKVYFRNEQSAFKISSFGGKVVLEGQQQAKNVEFTGENCEFICRSNSLKQYNVDVKDSKFECYSNSLESIKITAKGNSSIKTKSALNMTMSRESTTSFTSVR